MDDDERMAQPDGHRYDAPESKEETSSKGVVYLVLGLLVVVLMVLMATGTVRVFPG